MIIQNSKNKNGYLSNLSKSTPISKLYNRAPVQNLYKRTPIRTIYTFVCALALQYHFYIYIYIYIYNKRTSTANIFQTIPMHNSISVLSYQRYLRHSNT